MATDSSILAWRIPWTEEPGELQSMGSQSQTWLSNPLTHTDVNKRWENGIETCIISYVKWITNLGSMQDNRMLRAGALG